MTVAVLNAIARPILESRLPGWVEPRYFSSPEELEALAPAAEIGWFDSFALSPLDQILRSADKLRWLNTIAAGVDFFPLDLLRERGVTFTNGAGLNSITIAEYVVMGMLVVAKGYREVVRAQDRQEWLGDAPGKAELYGSRALIVGAGGIGGRVAKLLEPFSVDVTMVRRNPAPGVLLPDQWRAQLGEFDWVIIAVPSTPDTEKMIGAVIDQEALIAALGNREIGSCFLDVTDPEPLPPEHPLWGFDNVHISMHLSGRSQNTLILRAAERFVENLDRWKRGEPLVSLVDLSLGY